MSIDSNFNKEILLRRVSTMSSSGSLDLIKNKINFCKSYLNKNNFFKKNLVKMDISIS